MQPHSDDSSAPPFLTEACDWLQQRFVSVDRCAIASAKRIQQIEKCVENLSFGDTLSMIVFGSLARNEATAGSDIDWTLLVDGPSDPEHLQVSIDISKQLKESGLKKPGPSGLFSGLTSSHALIHDVGGKEDTNTNMTRRLLLLLESQSIAGSTSRERVIRNLLRRYIEFGRGVDPLISDELKPPRFLLNDFVRYWRTIAVDYASKKWLQDNNKWALRNTKLRFSRRLLFLKGLLICLDCRLASNEWPWSSLPSDDYTDNPKLRLQRGLELLIELTPIEVLCRAGLLIGDEENTRKALTAYDQFLAVLNNTDQRHELEQLSFDNASNNPTFTHVRALSDDFSTAIESLLFAGNDDIRNLTIKYGVF